MSAASLRRTTFPSTATKIVPHGKPGSGRRHACTVSSLLGIEKKD
ncbi:MAG: hypothetical protein ACXWWW_00245 [Candidatus Deferrimicrobiaceae bacterium]